VGQYHRPVNLTTKEFLYTHQLDCGLKAWEIIANGESICAAIAALVAVNPGNGPADLGNSPWVGRWAGHRLLCVGDYAENDDAKNIRGYEGPPLGDLYGMCDDDNLIPEKGVKDPNTFYNITPHMRGLIEQACSVRFLPREWTLRNADTGEIDHTNISYTRVPVKSRARAGQDGYGHYDLLGTENQNTLDYYKRAIPNFYEAPWDRAPGDGSSHGIGDDELDQGQQRVFANLDTHEFIDPVAFGEVATLASIMRGDWGSASAFVGMLFEPERRGGGDLYSESPLIGRWRNDRVIASGEYDSREFPTTEYIRKNWDNISSDAVKFIATEKES
jgi:hypothetical protein